MKEPEDEAFEDLAKRQGNWGMQGSRKHQILRYAESKGTGMKCAVQDCENHAHEGKFVGLLCAPCHTFIAGDGGLYSQAYRNSRNMIDTAIAMEPVAWMNPSWIDPNTRGWQSDSFESIPIEGWLPLYTQPPQRTWVGLTVDELITLEQKHIRHEDLSRAIEAKIKENNTPQRTWIGLKGAEAGWFCHTDFLNARKYTKKQREHICCQLLSEAQSWDIEQYTLMMHDSTKLKEKNQ